MKIQSIILSILFSLTFLCVTAAMERNDDDDIPLIQEIDLNDQESLLSPEFENERIASKKAFLSDHENFFESVITKHQACVGLIHNGDVASFVPFCPGESSFTALDIIALNEDECIYAFGYANGDILFGHYDAMGCAKCMINCFILRCFKGIPIQSVEIKGGKLYVTSNNNTEESHYIKGLPLPENIKSSILGNLNKKK